METARRQPNLCFLPFAIDETLASIQASLFPEVSCPVGIFFVERGPLACVMLAEETADIYVHQVLNHGETPPEVISLICKHELLHLRIPPTEHDGVVVQHPSCFWEAERALCPERTAAWAWIWENLWDCLILRRKQERIDVRRRWKEVWGRPKVTIAECRESRSRGDRETSLEESGW